MTATEIIQELVSLQNSLRNVLDHESLLTRELQITRSYDFIYLDWNNEDDNLFARLEFTCNANSVVLKSFYCEERPLQEEIQKRIPASLQLAKATLPFSETVSGYLGTADLVAALTMFCTSGDDYRPGNFSRILLARDYILLSQINHMNAKSLAHKENYSLRDLEFFIPLTAIQRIKFHHDYQYGEMQVRFDDRSSRNNRKYGDRMREQLEKWRSEM